MPRLNSHTALPSTISTALRRSRNLVLAFSVAVMHRLLLSAVALVVCLLSLSHISLAGRVVLSDKAYCPCPGKERLPLTFVSATSVLATNTTAQIIARWVSSIHIISAVGFINGTQSASGKTFSRQVVADNADLAHGSP